MRKIVGLALVGAAVVAFVGADVFSSVYHGARSAVRDALTAEIPLETQLAEARAQVDRYAESIIRGEVAAENLDDMIAGVEREVTGLSGRVARERDALATLRASLGATQRGELVPASLDAHDADQVEALRRVRAFEAASDLLERRRADLARLRAEHGATRRSLERARGEQARLAEEVRVLAAELESLAARKAAARTREAVGAAGLAQSGYAEAQARIQRIRSQVREQNKLLQYYEVERVGTLAGPADGAGVEVDVEVEDAVGAIDQALARYPVR